MKSADEMLEELGFELHNDDNNIISYVSDKKYNIARKVVVVFYKGINNVSVHCGYGKKF